MNGSEFNADWNTKQELSSLKSAFANERYYHALKGADVPTPTTMTLH